MAETANWSEYYITNAGRILRQSCIAEGQTPVFTRAVIGTGKPTDALDIDMMTSPVAYTKDVIIKKSYLIEANHLCIVRVDNSGYVQDELVTEVAIYARRADQADEQAIMYGYAYSLDGHVKIPAQTSATNRKIYEITLDTNLSRASEIKIIYDETGLWVSHADLDDFIESLSADQIKQNSIAIPGKENPSVEDALSSLNKNVPMAKIATINHNLGYTPICFLYSTEYAAGTQGAGEGPAGGGAVVSIPIKVNLADSNKIEVYTIPKYANRPVPEIVQHSNYQYGIVWDGKTDNLILILR